MGVFFVTEVDGIRMARRHLAQTKGVGDAILIRDFL